jgi:antitoxin component YwqK of YwqJK toxin-antitoxin module
MRSGHFGRGKPFDSAQGKQIGEWVTYDKKGKVVKKTMYN